jgi:hypothetical protein
MSAHGGTEEAPETEEPPGGKVDVAGDSEGDGPGDRYEEDRRQR